MAKKLSQATPQQQSRFFNALAEELADQGEAPQMVEKSLRSVGRGLKGDARVMMGVMLEGGN
jgi:hypothetical protein